MITIPLERRIFNKIEVDPLTRCWNWKAGRFSNGRGAIYIGRKNHLAHRVAFEIYRGPIPQGMMVCHTCDNGLCCNPSHLFLGTAQDNTDDMMAKRRGNWPGPTIPRRGERSPTAKLTKEQVLAILADDRRLLDIAADYAVSVAAIGLIRQRKRWAHLHGEVI